MAQRLSEMGDIVASVLDAIPSPILVVDDDVQIIGFNLAAAEMVTENPEMVIRRRAGEVLHCLRSTEGPEGCGTAESCKKCPVRNSVNESVQGHRVVRKRAKMELLRRGRAVPLYVLVTTAPFTHQGRPLVLLILEDISELMELKSVLPICAHCKSIRDDREYWQCVESYFKRHLDLDFSHGLCPKCAKEMYPDFFEE